MDKRLTVAWNKRKKLWAEGYKLWFEGNKLVAEGNKLWADAVIEVYGKNCRMEWDGDKCILTPSGETISFK